ncbi:MAG: addiction module toxin RelE [Myxococcota bacterium]|nr:addiction module toxin RelE [Myxococcota bacterium]
MPSAWSSKDERKYDHIKESAEKRGKPADRAKEIAARTVNKQRREEGRTPNETTQGTGNPNTSYEERTKKELVNLAKERGVDAPTTKKKDELIRALRHH